MPRPGRLIGFTDGPRQHLDRGPAEPGAPHPRVRDDDKLLAVIGNELQRQTGRDFDNDWCVKVRDLIFNGQAVGNRESYARRCIRNELSRFVPTAQPPRFHNGEWSP